MSRENWYRWGTQDERGALNHIGPEQVRRAAALVQTGEVIGLAQSLSPRTPVPAHRAGIQHFMGRDGGDYAAGARRPGGFQFAEDTIVLPLHIGTHIDALCHAWYDDTLYNNFPQNGTRSTTGAAHCGIDKFGPVVGRGILLDIVRSRGAPPADGSAITREDLQRAATMGGTAPETGDIVLIRTGWQERQEGARHVSFETEPGLDLDAALWLAECEVAVIGADNFAVEQLPFPSGTVFPVHQRLIRDFGVPLLEGLVLRPLAARARAAFLFAAAPLPVTGGTGSPLAPIAVL